MKLLLICEQGLNSTILARLLAPSADELHVEYSLSAYYRGTDFIDPDVVVIMFSQRLFREHAVLKEMAIMPVSDHVPVVAMALHPEHDELREIIQTYHVDKVHVFPFNHRELIGDIEAVCR